MTNTRSTSVAGSPCDGLVAVEETLKLLKRQLELETAVRQKGGFGISEEQELRALNQRLTDDPEAIRAVLQASHPFAVR